MAIEFDTLTIGIINNSLTLPFQSNGDSRIAVAIVRTQGGQISQGIQFFENPDRTGLIASMSFLWQNDPIFSTEAWYLLDPPAVPCYVGVGTGFEGDAAFVAILTYKNAAQVAPSFDIATGTGVAPSIEIVSAAENIVVGLLAVEAQSVTASPGAGETERFDAKTIDSEFCASNPETESCSTNASCIAGYEQSGAALVSLTPTLSASADWIFIGLNLGVAPPLLTFPFLLPFERGQALSPTFNLPFEREGAVHSFSLPFERSAIVKPTMNLPFERRLLPLLSESATIIDSRRLLAAFSARLLDERTIIPAAPPLTSFIDTRSIFRAFMPFIDSRTIVPRSVILNSGVGESGEAQGGTLTTVILAPDASSTNGFYVGMWITIDGEERRITAYNGGTRTATVAALSSPPITGTPYSITVAKPGASKVLRPFAEVTES